MSGWQDSRSERGYAMVALLVGLAVMAVLMSVALPVWNTEARRAREEELVFRGNQYARAIALFQRKYAGAFPPDLDVLVRERFLRKKYKDPITGDDFQTVAPGAVMPGQFAPPAGARGARAGAQPNPSQGSPRTAPSTGRGATAGSGARRGRAGGPATGGAGIMGVASRSTETSLRLYNGRDKYNEWVFVGTAASLRAGEAAGPQAPNDGSAGRGGRGGAAGRSGRGPARNNLFGGQTAPRGTGPDRGGPGR